MEDDEGEECRSLLAVQAFLSFDRDAQGTQEVYILGIEGLIRLDNLFHPGLESRGRLTFHFIQSDGRFQHQQNIKPLFANILHHIGNLLRLGDRFVNGLS